MRETVLGAFFKDWRFAIFSLSVEEAAEFLDEGILEHSSGTLYQVSNKKAFKKLLAYFPKIQEFAEYRAYQRKAQALMSDIRTRLNPKIESILGHKSFSVKVTQGMLYIEVGNRSFSKDYGFSIHTEIRNQADAENIQQYIDQGCALLGLISLHQSELDAFMQENPIDIPYEISDYCGLEHAL